MSPRECLLDRIDQLRAPADAPGQFDAREADKLLSDIRVYRAACGVTHCPRPPQPGVSAGTREDAARLYR